MTFVWDFRPAFRLVRFGSLSLTFFSVPSSSTVIMPDDDQRHTTSRHLDRMFISPIRCFSASRENVSGSAS